MGDLGQGCRRALQKAGVALCCCRCSVGVKDTCKTPRSPLGDGVTSGSPLCSTSLGLAACKDTSELAPPAPSAPKPTRKTRACSPHMNTLQRRLRRKRAIPPTSTPSKHRTKTYTVASSAGGTTGASPFPSLESRLSVTGPSFTNDTSIIAPNLPSASLEPSGSSPRKPLRNAS